MTLRCPGPPSMNTSSVPTAPWASAGDGDACQAAKKHEPTTAALRRSLWSLARVPPRRSGNRAVAAETNAHYGQRGERVARGAWIRLEAVPPWIGKAWGSLQRECVAAAGKLH